MLGIQVTANLMDNNLFLFSIHSFVNFVFLSKLYYTNFFKKSGNKIWGWIGLSTIPMLISYGTWYTKGTFQSFDMLFYNLVIVCTALSYINIIMEDFHKIPKHYMVLEASILLLFSVEFIITLAYSSLIIRGFLESVANFWFFRAILVQLFYFSLIYFTWQEGGEIKFFNYNRK